MTNQSHCDIAEHMKCPRRARKAQQAVRVSPLRHHFAKQTKRGFIGARPAALVRAEVAMARLPCAGALRMLRTQSDADMWRRAARARGWANPKKKKKLVLFILFTAGFGDHLAPSDVTGARPAQMNPLFLRSALQAHLFSRVTRVRARI